jgi:saccharopine dehydrogenase (NAD+, L-lysine-forming)
MENVVWLRQETRRTERRTPLTPADAATLRARGVRVVVERCARRVFDTDDYRAVGCEVVDPGSWVDADPATVVLGIKELPDEPAALVHRHVMFGHAYKGQEGAAELLARFVRGGGTLLDLEYLVDADGRRLAAFGYWAGYVGAALGVLDLAGRLEAPVVASTRAHLDGRLAALRLDPVSGARALIIGARGRSGRGAVDALGTAGVPVTTWDTRDTLDLDRAEILAHDLLVNCILARAPLPPFVRPEDAANPARRLRVVADVTVDLTPGINAIAVNHETTTWAAPVREVGAPGAPLHVIAIDNLPSVLPREASEDFSRQLTRLLPGLWHETPEWRRCVDTFRAAAARTNAL